MRDSCGGIVVPNAYAWQAAWNSEANTRGGELCSFLSALRVEGSALS